MYNCTLHHCGVIIVLNKTRVVRKTMTSNDAMYTLYSIQRIELQLHFQVMRNSARHKDSSYWTDQPPKHFEMFWTHFYEQHLVRSNTRRIFLHDVKSNSIGVTKLHWNDSVMWNDTLCDSRKMDPKFLTWRQTYFDMIRYFNRAMGNIWTRND